MATHTGIDLYKCQFCDATFKSQSNRSTHYKRHHPTEYVPNMTRRTRPTAIVKENAVSDEPHSGNEIEINNGDFIEGYVGVVNQSGLL